MLAKLAELYPSRFVLVGRRPLKVSIRADIMTLHPELDWPAVSWALGYHTRIDTYLAAMFEVQRGSTWLAMSRTR